MKYSETFIGKLCLASALLIFSSCLTTKKNPESSKDGQVQIIGAMRNVMMNGEIDGIVNLDSLKDHRTLNALGPLDGLAGEIMVLDGKSYVSTVGVDQSIRVEEDFNVSAPFLAYANIQNWHQNSIPENIKSLKDLEIFLTNMEGNGEPFFFKLSGNIKSAKIHVVNLPKGTKINSPKEAHQGQRDYFLENEKVDILGFYSNSHRGIFTHHDTNLHLHLINESRAKMGHLDSVEFGDDGLQFYLGNG